MSAPEILLLDALIAFAVRGYVNCSEENRERIKTPEATWIEEEGSGFSADCGAYVILNQQYVPFHEYLVSPFKVFFWFLSTLVQYIQIVVLLYPTLGYAFKRYSQALIQRLVCGGIRSVHENSEPTPMNR